MANEELGKLSPEQLQRLAGVISEAKNLTNQQAEIIEKVLAGENEIGKLRIAHLEKYFDIYSKSLDLIARKYSSLNEVFLILGEKLNNNYKDLSSDITDLAGRLEDLSKTSHNTEGTKKQTRSKDKTGSAAEESESIKVAKEILQVLKNGVTLNNNQQKALLAGIREAIGQTATSTTSKNGQQINTAANKSSETIYNAFQEFFEQGLSRFMAYSASADPAHGPLAPRVETYVDSDTRESLSALDLTTLPDLIKERDRKLQEAEQELERARLDLALARIDDEAAHAVRAAEFRYNKEKEFLEAVTKAQNQAHQTEAQIAYAKTANGSKELGRWRAQQIEAEEELKSRLEIEQQIADLRKQKEAEIIAVKGKLSATDAARIEKELAKEHSQRLKNLKDYTKNRAEADNAARFKELNPEAGLAVEKAKAKFIAEEERKARKQKGTLTKEDKEAIKKRADAEFAQSKLNQEKLAKIQQRADKKQKMAEVAATDQRFAAAASFSNLSKEDNLVSRFKELKSMFDDADEDKKGKAGLAVAIKTLSTLVQQLESSIDKIALNQGEVDTRLQGSSNKKFMGSYWNQLNRDMMSVGAVTPFFRQETFAANMKDLVNKGIAFDLKQRAFLMTIQEKIANTFNVADGTLLRLIRIQQEDSTAGRLGMESALNSFLNEMYETSEYLSDVAASVRGSLEEMESLMAGAAATEVEYQVQKWMGSLYSVGMSQSAVTSISNTLGQIAAGQIEGLTNGGAGSLLVMAANNAGIPISEILAKGLDADKTNQLLQATVNYLAEIAESSKDNNVVQQQLADVFGVRASDLKAAVNLAAPGTTDDIFSNIVSGKTIKTYDNMLKQLNDMAGSMIMRTSIGEMMTNIWENGQYSIASSMANNPIAYLLYKVAGLLDETTGGIALPFLNVMGFGVDLETTVADLMRLGAVSTGVLGSLGPMISGLASSFSGRSMLSKMGIKEGSGLAITPRGGGVGGGGGAGSSNASTSGSGFVGNSSSSDIKNSTIQESEDSKKQQMIEAKEEEPANQVDMLNTYVLKIYELLNDVAQGNKSLSVKMAGYGLIGGSSSGSQGGVGGLSNNASSGSSGGGNGTSFGGSYVSGSTSGGYGSTGGSTGGSSSASSGAIGGGSVAGSTTSGGVDLGGWTMM